MINILFFGQLKEQLKTTSLTIEWHQVEGTLDTVSKLKSYLANLNDWSEYFSNGQILVAVNQQLVSDSAQVADSDEVAFFPPVTGG